MNVKGVAFLAREALVTQEHGKDVWDAFITTVREQVPFFTHQVLPISKIPIKDFLRFSELLAARFYPGDNDVYWKFGITAAKQALVDGQLRGLFSPGDERKFFAFCPNIYKSYFDGGELTVVEPNPTAVDLIIKGVPKHPYFDGAIIGFARGGMEVLRAKYPIPTRVRDVGVGADAVHYRFQL